MRDEWSDSNHFRIQFFNKHQIFVKSIYCLSWGANHKAASCLISDFLQYFQTILSMRKGHLFRMKFSVMCLIRSFMSQQISVCSRIKICLITFFRFLSDRKSHCTVRIPLFNLPDNLTDFFICKIRILSSLQNKSTKSQIPSGFTAGQYLF